MIKLTITTRSGTTVSIDIPDTDEQQANQALFEALSAPVYHNAPVTRQESPIPAQQTEPQDSCPDWLVGSPAPKASELDRVFAHGEKMEEGEVGGEEGGCKGEEGELGGEEEEKPEQNGISLPTRGGGKPYVPSPALMRDLIALYGKDALDREMMIARTWLNANTSRQKTYRGTGRFIAAWMQRVARSTPQVAHKKTGSLIDINGTETQEGW